MAFLLLLTAPKQSDESHQKSDVTKLTGFMHINSQMMSFSHY